VNQIEEDKVPHFDNESI